MRKSAQESDADKLVKLLEALLIVQLAGAGVPQRHIRKIVGCSMGRVTSIARWITSPRRNARK